MHTNSSRIQPISSATVQRGGDRFSPMGQSDLFRSVWSKDSFVQSNRTQFRAIGTELFGVGTYSSSVSPLDRESTR